MSSQNEMPTASASPLVSPNFRAIRPWELALPTYLLILQPFAPAQEENQDPPLPENQTAAHKPRCPIASDHRGHSGPDHPGYDCPGKGAAHRRKDGRNDARHSNQHASVDGRLGRGRRAGNAFEMGHPRYHRGGGDSDSSRITVPVGRVSALLERHPLEGLALGYRGGGFYPHSDQLGSVGRARDGRGHSGRRLARYIPCYISGQGPHSNVGLSINGGAPYGPDLPFGGYKQIHRRQNGVAGVQQYPRVKSPAWPAA